MMTFKPATPEQIAHLQEWFTVTFVQKLPLSMKVNEEGVWQITGHVRLHRFVPDGVCPIKFDKVVGSFIANQYGLVTCKNLPHTVGGNLLLMGNELKDLTHCSDYVGGVLDLERNPLVSLEGLPSHVGHRVQITYTHQLPLLRLLSIKNNPVVGSAVHLLGGPPKVKHILKDYQGMGKPGAIKAAAELIKAGFRENARW
jgi:hypothetical protein